MLQILLEAESASSVDFLDADFKCSELFNFDFFNTLNNQLNMYHRN